MAKKVKEYIYLIWLLVAFEICPRFFSQKYTFAKLNVAGERSKYIFLKIKKRIECDNINRIKNKTTKKIGIIIYSGAMWSVDGLYKQLNKKDEYEIDIIVGRFNFFDNNSMLKTYNDTCDFFSRKGYNVKTNLQKEDIRKYDILIYTTPYDFLDKDLNILNISLNTLICYISYSYMLAGNDAKFNLPMYYLVWKYFCDSKFYLEKIKLKCRLFSNNVIYSGFPKMDDIYKYNMNKRENVKKVIIYAPHHSVTYDTLKAATFDENYLILLELAQKYSDFITWIVKPHPLLADRCIQRGIFNNQDEYEAYWKEWDMISKTSNKSNEEYFGLFNESDAMITDSVSFLAEYQFTHKPLLLMESGKMMYNEFGNEIVKQLYRCAGDDYDSIEKFIIDVIRGEDKMQKTRERFFAENLDYLKCNGTLANDYIYNFFLEQF